MKVFVENNIVFATHADNQEVDSLYPGKTMYIVPDDFRKEDGDVLVHGDSFNTALPSAVLNATLRKQIDLELEATRKLGFTCTNGIKIQCAEIDVIRWMQAKSLMDLAGLTEVTIRDYDNVNHTVSAQVYNGMVTELGAYLQGLLATAWGRKDALVV